MITGFVAVLASALFAGAAVYITFVEHPARLSCGPAVALRQWIPSYKRATVMQASLAIVATIAGLLRWWAGREWQWLAGAILIFAMTYGKGKIVLFGFRPQHRGQTHATFPLLFNALYWSVQ